MQEDLSRKLSRLIALNHGVNNSRRFQRTPEDTTPKKTVRGFQVGSADPIYRSAGLLGPPVSLAFV